KTTKESEEQKEELKREEVDSLIKKIELKKEELKDESNGAEKVNEYLNNHFGHGFLALKAIEEEDSQTGGKKFRFVIHRDNKKAFHLSEGEKSLISFCYFVAKLQDINTKDKKPILWIDDPISSLD